ERALVAPPSGRIGPITQAERRGIIDNSLVAGVYEKVVDRESAYERLKSRADKVSPAAPGEKGPWYANLPLPGLPSGSGRRGDSVFEAMTKSAARTIGSSVGRQIVRGVLGSLFGSPRR